MLHADYLVPELVCSADGAGPAVETFASRLVLTLGITQVTEREGLEVSIWGSEDGYTWGTRPLARFPTKSYCGQYSIAVDLRDHPRVHWIRAIWKLKSWIRAEREARFGFWVTATGEEVPPQLQPAGGKGKLVAAAAAVGA